MKKIMPVEVMKSKLHAGRKSEHWFCVMFNILYCVLCYEGRFKSKITLFAKLVKKKALKQHLLDS